MHDHETALSRVLPMSVSVVHAWRMRLDQSDRIVRTCQRVLSLDEIQRARHFPALRRKRFLTTRGFLRMILSSYLSQEPNRLRFQYGPGGKPEVEQQGEVAHPLRFNLSHSDRMAILVVAWGRRVGVDLEQI